MKSGMPFSEFRNITISHDNNLIILLICVHRPVEWFFKPYVMFFNIIYANWYNVELRGSQKYNF